MIANAGTNSTEPPVTNDAVINPVAVLLCKMAVTTMPARNAANLLRRA